MREKTHFGVDFFIYISFRYNVFGLQVTFCLMTLTLNGSNDVLSQPSVLFGGG